MPEAGHFCPPPLSYLSSPLLALGSRFRPIENDGDVLKKKRKKAKLLSILELNVDVYQDGDSLAALHYLLSKDEHKLSLSSVKYHGVAHAV